MDDRMFRNAMGKYVTGVTIVTTELDGEVHGMTANAFMSVSLNPRLVLISISENAKMLGKINASKKFAVNILSEDQKEISMLFAGQIKEKREIEFDRLGELPVIRESLANISCKVYSQHVEGDHTLFVGEVTDLVLRDGDPLTFYEGKYCEIAKLVDIN
ncbi:flavin reductase family protein [Neobacillus sp. OS1-32]|uniref:flavin reductase family protein n=1 Tax=Neobacillus sp. OS1-32 TaxID=3070682 RepID=UPI0027DEBBA3|nr:flavin reductase family protein [Neobacillus sp. OS1-32]WML31773.1 flavin reductase family protein [Neobacillus sp. OS1-32]